MKVHLKFFEGVSAATGEKENTLTFKGESIRLSDLVERLIELYGEKFRNVLYGRYPDEEPQEMATDSEKEVEKKEIILKFIINGEMMDYNPDTIIGDGDNVALVIPIGGG